MCDTFVATPDFTATGNMIFGKNSDREPNEAQALTRLPRAAHTESELQATYIRIPQVPETNEVILSKPFQMWGAEMGVNEHGLAIGNEALFSRLKVAKKNTGLTGMDMLRVALERADSAERALEQITSLTEAYGQDACGGYTDRNFYYYSSFIIADAKEAFVLETADRHWVAARVRGYRAISNGMTLESDFDFSSQGIEDFARARGFLARGADFNFREAFSDRFYTYFSKCRIRRAVSESLGNRSQAGLDAGRAMAILRDHGDVERDGVFQPARADAGCLCMHASGLTSPSQTTGSLVAELRADAPSTYWFTGTAAPCLSTFKPFFIPGQALKRGDFPEPGAKPDDSLWWRHERLHRHVLLNYPERSPSIIEARDQLEREFINAEAERIARGTPSSLDELSFNCLARADAALQKSLSAAEQSSGRPGFAPRYRSYRARINRACGMEI